MANELGIKWKDEDSAAYYLNAANLHEIHPDLNTINRPFLIAASATTLTLKSDTAIKVINSGVHKVFNASVDKNIVIANNLDTGSIAAGKDYYVYVVDNADGTASIKISRASTYPSGASAANSRKVGGFHTLCADVGVIAGHPLSGYAAGAILPASVWCLNFRPESSPEGMVWSDDAKIWVDIYLANTSYGSTYHGSIKDNTNWMDFVDGLGGVGKQLLTDSEFQIVAAGSNEETNIVGSTYPGTTGGHTDTAGRRMISHIGCEDCCGVEYQWLNESGYRLDGADFAVAKVFGYYDLPGDKGSLYCQGTGSGITDVKLRAGGRWGDATNCGSRCRFAAGYRWNTGSDIGGRGRARSQGAR